MTPWTCSACGKTFGGLSGFDDHRVGAYVDRHPDYGRSCLSPDEFRAKGYEQNSRGLWGRPMPDEVRAQLRALSRTEVASTLETVSA